MRGEGGRREGSERGREGRWGGGEREVGARESVGREREERGAGSEGRIPRKN